MNGLKGICKSERNKHLVFNPSNAEATFVQSTRTLKFLKFENHLNTVIGFNHFSGFLNHFVLAKLVTSSIRIKSLESQLFIFNIFTKEELNFSISIQRWFHKNFLPPCICTQCVKICSSLHKRLDSSRHP